MQISSNSLATSPVLASPSAAAMASDFDTFLRMLTVQIQNQDPLNPMESKDFAVQLATFAGVEQQVRTNQSLAAMTAQMTLGTVTQLAGWIGMEARVSAPVVYQGSPVALATAVPAVADRAVLVVTDAYGRVLAREPVPVDQSTFQWEGRAADGTPLPEGQYALTVESYLDDTLLQSRSPSYYAVIDEARIGADGAELVLVNGQVVNAAQITALRR